MKQEKRIAAKSKKAVKIIFIISFTCCFAWVGGVCNAQTYVQSGVMTGTPTPGAYYNSSSITLTAPFSFTASAGSSLNVYIKSDCWTLNTASSNNQNYILTSTPRISGITNSAGLSNQIACQLMQTIQYFDGLGRPLQNVQVKGSAMGYDVVVPEAYDALGREAQKYLPYAATTNDGSYKNDALNPGAGVQSYYNPTGSGTSGSQQNNGVVTNPNPYSLTVFESSPLNRTIEQGSPGTPWQPVPGTAFGHTLKIIYGSNDAANTSTGTGRWARSYSVKIDPNSGLRTLVDNGSTGYAANLLYLIVKQNENWVTGQSDPRLNTNEEYQDITGHVVLKRSFNYTAGALQMLSTYYVYDDFGNLAFVLPPGANPDAGLSSANNQTTLNNLCYQYNYDARNRMISKQLPGKGIEQMVYNLLDHVIFSQDANQLSRQEWAFTKYDVQGRVIMTGIEKQNTSTWSALQAYVTNALTNYSATYQQWEVPVTSGGVQGYSNNCFPMSANVVPMAVNYYDNYNFPNAPSTVAAPAGASTNLTGLLTATKTAVLNTIYNTTPDMLWTVHYYDDLGRLTQTYAQHYLGGTLSPHNFDVVSTTYNFNNQPVTSTRLHYNTTNTTAPVLTIANTYTYDHVGRKTQTFEQINGGSNILLSQTDFNEVGQVKTKHLHSATGGAPFMQDIPYTYNERGWLLSSGTGSSNALFQEQLGYNTGTTPQYNGNIASVTTINNGAAANTSAYLYDPLNRLLSATNSNGFTENNIGYDLMGNITSLNRYQGAAGTLIDQLSYQYTSNNNATNQLQTITDVSGNNAGVKNGTGNYSYDANGNVTTDQSRSTGNIGLTYNELNLPQTVTGARTITYFYDANGTKLRRASTTAGTGTGNTDYISGIQYDASGTNDPAITFIQTEEGRATPSGNTFIYDYYLTDHLGNTRVTFDTHTTTPTVLQSDDYYAFGMEINNNLSGTKNEYLYNKKELQEELGQYDYGARFYDPVIARWGVVDPMAEAGRRFSPYNYVLNNPVRLIDPDGMYYDESNASASIAADEARWASNAAGIEEAKSAGNFNGGNGSGGGNQGEDPPATRKTTKADATRVSHKLKKPKFRTCDYCLLPGAAPLDQGTISSWPPPEPINYQDLGLRTTSLAIGKNVINWYSGISSVTSIYSLFTVGSNMNNIALGVSEHLDDFAKNVNGTTWTTWGAENFPAQFESVINNESNLIHFNLDGISNPWSAVAEGAKGLSKSRATSWELYKLYTNQNALGRTIFYQGGKIVANPFQ